MNDPLKYFRVEARELLEQLQSGLIELEQSSTPSGVVDRLLRLAHTLKGAARVVKQTRTADLAHELEDLLLPLRGAEEPPQTALSSKLLSVVDVIAEQVSGLLEPALEERQAAPKSSIPPPATERPSQLPRPAPAAGIQLEPLLHDAGELAAQLTAARRALDELSDARKLCETLDRRLELKRSSEVAGGTAPLRALSAELHTTLAKLEREFGTSLTRATRELGSLRDRLEQLKLIPASSIFGTLERATRDAAVSLGKQATFDAQGGDVRLDAEVLGAVERALLQAVRNAVAHGIESSPERARVGKPATGRVSLRVERRGKRISFACRDDGRGVDLDSVRRAAERLGRPTPEAPALERDALLDLLVRGGVSTASEVSQVAGRGVGLNLIRDALSAIGGVVSLDTQPGMGTELRLEVPLSLAALDALLVEVAGAEHVLPLSSVQQALRVSAHELSHTATESTLRHEGRAVPFAPLSRLLQRSTTLDDRQTWSVVLLKTSGGLLALGVDRLRGSESVVARALPDAAPIAPTVVGVALDAEGNPRLLLDPDALFALAIEVGGSASPPERAKRRVLLVDDSLTTRMLEQSILESAGYAVELATSGEEGLERALANPPDLMLVDVEMPGMDGFSFVEKVRADPRLSRIPAVLVTSRVTPQDLARGKAAGASDHIAKGEFDQVDFLRRIEGLFG